jgi:hypothetical protein
MTQPTDTHPRLHRTSLTGCALVAASGLLLSGCSDSGGAGTPEGLLLSGPDTNIVVTIPDGWHQVINSANPLIPQMVAPTTCMGSNEVACATGLARTATITAPNIEQAAKDVQQAVTSAPGVTDVTMVGQGPGKLGKRDGFRQRFTFRNPGTSLTAEVAAVPSGPTTPDPQGHLEYSVVLVWISDQPDAPKPEVIDQIVGSTLVHGGVPTP